MRTEDWGSSIWLMEAGRSFDRKGNKVSKIIQEGIYGAWGRVMVYQTEKLGGKNV